MPARPSHVSLGRCAGPPPRDARRARIPAAEPVRRASGEGDSIPGSSQPPIRAEHSPGCARLWRTEGTGWGPGGRRTRALPARPRAVRRSPPSGVCFLSSGRGRMGAASSICVINGRERIWEATSRRGSSGRWSRRAAGSSFSTKSGDAEEGGPPVGLVEVRRHDRVPGGLAWLEPEPVALGEGRPCASKYRGPACRWWKGR